MKKSTKIIISCFTVFLTMIFVAVNIYFFGATYKDYYSYASAEFKIPGLETKFVPQGMAYENQSHCFLISGYMSDGSESRIYIVDKQTSQIKYVTLMENGVPYVLHAGGITVYENNVFVAGDKKVVRFLLSDLISCENEKAINIIDSFKTGNGCDFLEVYNNQLIVGEFYKKDKYNTDPSHHVKISETETNYALSLVYELNPNNIYGLESLVPTKAISMPNQVQGMTFTKNGNIFLSTSYSIANSKLLIYQNVLSSSSEKTITIENNHVSLYVLNNENLISSIEAPSMSEEPVLVDGKVYLLFESNCQKYRLVNRTKISDVHSLDI